MMTQLEAQLVSVERIKEYTEVASEVLYQLKEIRYYNTIIISFGCNYEYNQV